jgi:PhzF family phenazine biosynthesis protein
MEIPFYQVDAFSSRVFAGNPAAICPLNEWLPDEVMQSIAMENNLAETAFFVPEGGGFRLRWFTPEVEVDLCGHATLASAYVLMTQIDTSRTEVSFHTRSGELRVTRHGDRYAMNFPSRPPQKLEVTKQMTEALGAEPMELWAARDYMAVFESESAVKALRPDMGKTAALDKFAVIVTAPGDQVDFVSRFFAPSKGVPEDPVTGSAHCTLIPYWADRLGKTVLQARQISRRGGELHCELIRDRVNIIGHAALFAVGKFYIES